MNKIIFGIFAHPDDEAFGPAGALLRETRAGTDLHLITLTAGDAGANPDGVDNLGEVRQAEWRAAGALLGAHSLHFFGYKDGHLNNLAMIEIAQRVVNLVIELLHDTPADAEVEFMSLDLNGYTGHIDHIVAARAAALAFYRLKQSDTRITRIRFACLPAHLSPATNTDWLYMDAGHTPAEIDETIDARDLRGDIIAIMKTHRSQRQDAATTLAAQGEALGLCYFVVKT
jgi:LmbE family N-acetylglucosaminyl deacetylase